MEHLCRDACAKAGLSPECHLTGLKPRQRTSCRVERNDMVHRLCGPRCRSSEFQPGDWSPQVECGRAQLWHGRDRDPPHQHSSSRARTTGDPWDPDCSLAFAHQCQFPSRMPPSPWCSSRYRRISPLHLGIHIPLPELEAVVSRRSSELSWGISCSDRQHDLRGPSRRGVSPERPPPLYQPRRWHKSRAVSSINAHVTCPVSTSKSMRPDQMSLRRPSSLDAASRRQACADCEQFPTAASRRSLGRVSVPVWPSALSGRLLIVALVSHYLTN